MPIDKSLFPRLRRLFSTDVIIRNVGGNELQTFDLDHIQSTGYLQTNNLIDRFTRIHKAGSRLQYNSTLNYQTLRIQLYSDYEAMDYDAYVSAALDMISDDATGKSEIGEVLAVKSSNENIQTALYSLFYHVLNVEFNLKMWIRSLCKYGDLYLKLDIAEKYGVYNVVPLSVYDIIREEGKDPHNPYYVCFRVDPTSLAGGNRSAYNKQKFENYEIAHFRFVTDPNYLPYGRSYLEPARKTYKQMTLMEDAVLLHRIIRAADKRMFKIDVGNIPQNEVNDYMERIKDSLKRTPYIDQQTGEYNLKFNVQNLLEDFYIPVRGKETTTSIETAKGLEYTGMEDVIYLRDKMFAALKIPKDRLNMTADVNGKATLATIGVNWSKTVEKIQQIVISELKKIAMVHLYTLGYDESDLGNFSLSLTIPSIVYKQEKVALLKEQVDLINQIREGKILSTDWCYHNILELSEDQIETERELMIEDEKRTFRFNQIMNEGNDPVETGESFGTPHDLASLYGPTYSKPDVPKGYDEEEPASGRPKEKMSTFGTQDSEFGADPMGAKSRLEPYKPTILKPQYKGSPIAENTPQGKMLSDLAKIIKNKAGRKISLYEAKQREKDGDGFLSEDNIKDVNTE